VTAGVLFVLWALPLATAADAYDAPSLLFSVVRTLLALAGVCALAWVSLSWLARRGIGVPGRGKNGRIEVLERIPLGPRKTLYLVRADGRDLLLGTGEGGSPSLIVDLGPTRTTQSARSADEGSVEERPR
jgi:flagellar biogenesis protein FliO